MRRNTNKFSERSFLWVFIWYELTSYRANDQDWSEENEAIYFLLDDKAFSMGRIYLDMMYIYHGIYPYVVEAISSNCIVTTFRWWLMIFEFAIEGDTLAEKYTEYNIGDNIQVHLCVPL